MMSEPPSLPHPQKLYATLRGGASAEIRARAVLDFLRASTRAEIGFLFLARGADLALVASTTTAPAPDLIAEAMRLWNRELDHQPDSTNKTLDVSTIEAMREAQSAPLPAAVGGGFERRMLSFYQGARWVPVGLAMLQPRAGWQLTPTRQVYIAAVCNALLDAGDITEPAPDLQPR